MKDLKVVPNLDLIPNEMIFEEVAQRLKELYRMQHGVDFLFGCFEFMFHEGRFQGIEDRPRYKRYKSPGRITAISNVGKSNGVKKEDL